MGRQRISQEALCARIGMSQSTLSRRLVGEYPFNTTELSAIADALGVPVTRFVLSPDRMAAA